MQPVKGRSQARKMQSEANDKTLKRKNIMTSYEALVMFYISSSFVARFQDDKGGRLEFLQIMGGIEAVADEALNFTNIFVSEREKKEFEDENDSVLYDAVNSFIDSKIY